MISALTSDMLATDVADYLVQKGVPFRQTHHIAGSLVKRAEELNTTIDKLNLGELKDISAFFEDDIVEVFDFEKSVERRSALGTTSKDAVLHQVGVIKNLLSIS
jgi:argininosuccinate lyase